MSDLPPPPPEFEPGPYSAQRPAQPDPTLHSSPARKGWAALGTGQVVELAGPGARFGARFLDGVIIAVGTAALLIIGLAVGLVVFLILAVVALVFVLSYEVALTTLKGQTLGKMATNIKVVRADNGELVGWGESIGRWIIPTALLIIPAIGWLLALLVYTSLTWDKYRQGWHDKAVGTIVIRS